jgi:hypothetical protein
MDTIADTNPPGRVTETLERSETQIEPRQTVALEPALDRLRASIAEQVARLRPEDEQDAMAWTEAVAEFDPYGAP